MGSTGSGKSVLAEMLADHLGAVLVNADAFQVYRGLDIGTNKPVDRGRYELLDIVELSEQFGVGEWLRRVEGVLAAAWRDSRHVVVVGGTGLYVRALFEGYAEMSGPPDPELRQKLMAMEAEFGLVGLLGELDRVNPARGQQVDRNNPVRVRRALEIALGQPERVEFEVPPFERIKFGLFPEPIGHLQRLNGRVLRMLELGWIEECRSIFERNPDEKSPGLRAIGYHTLKSHLDGFLSLEDAVKEIQTLTAQYAKRQRTWLRREPGLIPLEIDLFEDEWMSDALARMLAKLAEVNGN